ncbi:MAG: hypothetical protein JW889_12930 [Verrucomicrobia bacterium]|nr:hypothetical protein [Verrucomicrobiota bacterium]
MRNDADRQGPQHDACRDPDLESLPKPRRPGRRLTLATLTITAMLALGTAWSLRNETVYAFRSGRPTNLGELGELKPTKQLTNRWVRGQAGLVAQGAIRYRRPLERDAYELARVEGSSPIWVQVLIPGSVEPDRFVPPASFVGRLVPVAGAGLRFGALDRAVAEAGGPALPEGAWLLIDGEAPNSTGWALPLVAMLFGFAGFSVWGLVRLLQPVRSI